MQYDDHNPPHIHIIYAEFKGIAFIKDQTFKGDLPPRVKLLVTEWMKLHEADLLHNWDLAVSHKILNYIDPLN